MVSAYGFMGTMVIVKGHQPLLLLLLFNLFIEVYSIQTKPVKDPPRIEILQIKNESLETETKNDNTFYVIPDNTKVLSFKCSSSEPTEWVFQCPDINNVDLYTVTKSREINGTKEQVDPIQFTSHLIINMTGRDEQWYWQDVLNMSCRYRFLNSSQSLASAYSVILPSTCKNSEIPGKCFQISQFKMSDTHSSCEVNDVINPIHGFHNGILQVDLQNNRFFCIERNVRLHNDLSKAVKTKHCGNYNDFCKSYLTQVSEVKGNQNSSKSGRFMIEWVHNKTDAQEQGVIPLNPSGPWIIYCNFNTTSKHDVALHYVALHVMLVPPDQRSSIHRYKYKREGLQFPLSNWTLLVKPKLDQKKFWSGTKVEFQCNATLSSFYQGFVWKVIRKSGTPTKKTLSKANNRKDIAEGNYIYFGPIVVPEAKDYEMNIQTHKHILTTAILLDPDVTQIQCIAPVVDSFNRKSYNYTLMVNAYQTFTLHDPKNDKNSTNNILSCNASGGALPKYKWTVDGIDRSVLQVVTEVEDQWVSSTLVLEIRDGDRKVLCIAENGVDTKTISFTLTSNGKTLVLILAISSVTAILGVTALVLLYKWRKKRNISRMMTVEEIEEFLQGAKRTTEDSNDVILLPYDTNLEIPRTEITIEDTVLGSGQFGIVIVGRHNSQIVAIKTVRPTTEKAYLIALLSELKILQYIGNHPHIVNLVGACTGEIKKMEVLLILEYCANGNLVKYLRACRKTFVDNFSGGLSSNNFNPPLYVNNSTMKLTSLDLIRMSMEIADAMNYVSEKKILHGDLAARNVLVTENQSVKICDFGLSKRLYAGYYVYTQKLECPLPLRWMAIESLKDMSFSMESDVWSFGVTMWELFTLAEIPYPGVNWGFESWKLLRDGYRLEKPQFSNDAIYEIMKSCWNDDPADRPPFSELENELRTELNKLLLY